MTVVAEGKQAKNGCTWTSTSAPAARPIHQVDAEVQRLVGLGATVTREHDGAWGPWPEYHYVMADPEGNEFCVQ